MKIKDIANMVGGVVALSTSLGLSRGAVSQWTCVPWDKVIRVSELTGWRATPHQIRPDIYPNPTDGLPMDREEAA